MPLFVPPPNMLEMQSATPDSKKKCGWQMGSSDKDEESELPRRRPRKQAPSNIDASKKHVTKEDDADPVRVNQRRMSMSEAVHDYTCAPQEITDDNDVSQGPQKSNGSPDEADDVGLNSYRALRDEAQNRVAWHDEVSVNMKRTIKMFLYHTLYPVSLPFMMVFEGTELLKSVSLTSILRRLMVILLNRVQRQV